MEGSCEATTKLERLISIVWITATAPLLGLLSMSLVL